jgi:RNA polymerase sigma factor (sigma-70 family)
LRTRTRQTDEHADDVRGMAVRMNVNLRAGNRARPGVPSRSREQSHWPACPYGEIGEQLTTILDQDLGVPDVASLMRRAASGDHWAWERLVDQYARLIWSITVDFKLVESDAADVAQTTWLRLLEHIDRIEYPDRLGSWLAATARNESLRCLAARKRVVPSQDDVELNRAMPHGPAIDEQLLADERARVVREAMSHLPWRWQRLLDLLMVDPPVSYADISDELGLPIGSIGPTRARCLARLRVLLQAF